MPSPSTNSLWVVIPPLVMNLRGPKGAPRPDLGTQALLLIACTANLEAYAGLEHPDVVGFLSVPQQERWCANDHVIWCDAVRSTPGVFVGQAGYWPI